MGNVTHINCYSTVKTKDSYVEYYLDATYSKDYEISLESGLMSGLIHLK